MGETNADLLSTLTPEQMKLISGGALGFLTRPFDLESGGKNVA
jgi:hypothetical protein